MKQTTGIYFIITTVLFFHNFSVAKVYFDIDFSCPRHTTGKMPEVSSSVEDISKIVFGQPIVAKSQDLTKNQFLVFNTEGNKPDFYYDQIQLNMYGTVDFYYISFDILTKNLINSRNDFTIYFLQKISFQSNGKINIADQEEVAYRDDYQYLFEIHIDNKKNEINYFLDKKKVYTFGFIAAHKFEDIRFSLGLTYSNQKIDNTSIVGIDNIYISDCIPIEQDLLTSSQTIDQSQTKYDYVSALGSNGSSGQTFTAGTDGHLTGVCLLLQGSGISMRDSPVGSDIRVDLRRIYPNGALQPKIIATGVQTKEEIVREEPKWITILFERPYKQRDGEKLAFTITELSDSGENVYNNYGGTRENLYVEGHSFMSSSRKPLTPSTSDMAFKTLVAKEANDENRPLGPPRNTVMSFALPVQKNAQKYTLLNMFKSDWQTLTF